MAGLLAGGFTHLLIAGVVGAVIAGSGVGYVTYKVMHDRIAVMQRDAAVAAQKATAQALDTKARTDAVVLTAALQEARNQQALADTAHALHRRIALHVTPKQDARYCVSYGLVRVLDAATRGLDPASLPLAPGQSDDACAPVKSSALAGSVADNYGTARANAEQLNALEDAIRAEVETYNASPHSH